MNYFMTAIPIAISGFIATNLDDICILLVFFSQVNHLLRRRHIVMGQYLGFTILVLASLPGFFGGMLLPQTWIGMLGIVPFAIGVSRFLNRDNDELQEKPNLEQSEVNSQLPGFLSPQIYGVAAVTFANGGDNLGIYVPLFASCTWESLLMVLGVFFALVGVWCYAAYRLARVPIIAQTITRYGNYLVPFVLIALGISILVENHTLESLNLPKIALLFSIIGLLLVNRNGGQSLEVGRD